MRISKNYEAAPSLDIDYDMIKEDTSTREIDDSILYSEDLQLNEKRIDVIRLFFIAWVLVHMLSMKLQ